MTMGTRRTFRRGWGKLKTGPHKGNKSHPPIRKQVVQRPLQGGKGPPKEKNVA